MRNFLTIFAIIIVFTTINTAQKTMKSPQDFFSNYGKTHTFHHQVLEYLRYLESNSDQIKIVKTGETYQGRPMHLVYVSSAENIKNIEEIRQTNLYNTGVSTQKPKQNIEKAIVWCSFGVHGNEAGCTESVPNIIYQLASGTENRAKSWLENTVVIIDPSLNPDGYDRYVHFIKSVSGSLTHPSVTHREHQEPWPSGRYNHYMFDMNRDWAWQTQKESQERIVAYNQWMPHIHADFHEMGYNENYYFAPAVEPYHQYLSPFQRSFQTTIGKNHASYFDKNGWLYWSREVFDLFYPSYGDTYPCYAGAIGMTYEQAGNSSSGRAIQLENGDTLTIQDKIDHNTVIALSTIEVASQNQNDIIKNFKNYFYESVTNPKGKYKTYVLKQNPSLDRLAKLFDRNGIRYGYAKGKSKATAYHYQSKTNEPFDIEAGDMVIQTAQPRSTYLQILMEEESKLNDSITYDITAWTLPFAYNTDCYAFTSTLNTETTTVKTVRSSPVTTNNYSYQIPWNDLTSAKILAALHQKGIKVRMNVKDASFNGKPVKQGSLFVNKGDNVYLKNFDNAVLSIIKSFEVNDYITHSSGFSDKGGDLGGNYFQMVKAPKILTFTGRGVSANSAGEIWYYFDQLLHYAVSMIDWDQFERANLDDYNTIILPDGYFNISDDRMQKLNDWTKKGGRLIVIEGTLSQFDGKKGLTFDKFATEDEKKADEENLKKQELQDRYNNFEGMERRNISKGTAGAIIKNVIDRTHPLAYGLGDTYYSLKTSSSTYKLQKGYWNVIRVPEKYDSFGFIGKELKPKLSETVSFAVQSHGSGQAIYMVDNPLFRCFWDRGLLLFSNAVFLNGYLPSNY